MVELVVHLGLLRSEGVMLAHGPGIVHYMLLTLRPWVVVLVGRRLLNVLLRILLPTEEEARLRLVDIIRPIVLEPTAPPVDLLDLILESVLEKDFIVRIFYDLFFF